MSEPFLAEIRMFGFNYAPRGWAFCNGQILPINQNQALYSLLGTTYGGDGRVNFALPNLQGRTPVHVGDGINLGAAGGEETHALSPPEMPVHTHIPNGTSLTPATGSAQGNLLSPTEGGRRPIVPYAPAGNLQSLQPAAVANTGAGQGHENMQPYLTLNFAIALQGVFPSRN